MIQSPKKQFLKNFIGLELQAERLQVSAWVLELQGNHNMSCRSRSKEYDSLAHIQI